jgi:hypothetical protein
MCKIVNVSRREFLKTGATVPGGLLLGFSLPFPSTSVQAETRTGFDATRENLASLGPSLTE